MYLGVESTELSYGAPPPKLSCLWCIKNLLKCLRFVLIRHL